MKQLVLPPGSRQGDQVVLAGREYHYLIHVRRLQAGDQISALETGLKLTLEVVKISPDALELKVLSQASIIDQSTRITLFPFLLKSRKLDDVIRQVAEAGVHAIVPIEGDHCISRLEDEKETRKKLERWRAISKEAAQQCGSNTVCEIGYPLSSRELPDFWENEGPLLFFHQAPLAKASLHRYLCAKPAAVGLIIGPEGGLSDREVKLFLDRGLSPAWLGDTVLRAETASVYAVAAVKTLLQEHLEWIIPT